MLDVVAAAETCQAVLVPAAERDWTVKAGDLDWDCRHTLDHAINAQLSYAANLASRSTERMPRVRQGDQVSTVAQLVAVIRPAACILAAVAREAPADARGFHSAGMADPEGFLAMGCDELLVHTHDIACGLGLDFQPPAELSRAVLRRLFPWAPSAGDAWQTLLWTNGRLALPDRPRLTEEEWTWHCAPLSEWRP